MPTRRPATKTSTRHAARRRPVRAPGTSRPARTAPLASAEASGPPPPPAAIDKDKGKGDKRPRLKLVRDSFTIPKEEYAGLDALKKRAAKSGLPSKKSELLRAGLKALAAMGDASFRDAMSAVPALKTGRAKKR